MDPIHTFSPKAAGYARYRWSYAPGAVRTIVAESGISTRSTVADIGAGTGILTHAFIGKAAQVYAIEPNPEMRRLAKETLERLAGRSGHPSPVVIAARAEALPLPDASIDLLTAAQAVHWFEPQAARSSFRRVLKPEGWLAIVRNYGADPALDDALRGIYPPGQETESYRPGRRMPIHFYFEGARYRKETYPFESRLTWKAFLGGISTASFAPDPGTSAYQRFASAAMEVFERFQEEGMITRRGASELYLGQVG